MLTRSISLNVAGQVGTLAIGFFSALLVARWLGPSDRGLLGVIGTSTSIVLVLANVGLPMAIWFHASRREPPTGALVGNTLLHAGAMIAVLVPVAVLLRRPLAETFSHGEGGLAWAVGLVVVPLVFLDWSTQNQLKGQLRFGLYNALVVGEKLLYLVLVVVFLNVIGWGVSGVIVAGGLGAALPVCGALAVLVRQERPRVELPLLRSLLGYGARTQVGSFFQSFNARFDILILQFFRPLRDVGYYAIAEFVAELVTLLARSFQSSVLPLVSRASDDPERQAETTVLALRHHALLSAAGVVVNAAFAPLLIVYGYGAAYRPALMPIFVLLPGVWFLGNGLVIGNDLSGRHRPGLSSLLSGIAVATTVGLDFALIPPFGVMGAAVASLIGYTVFGIVSVAVLVRVSGVELRQLVPGRNDLAVYAAILGSVAHRFRTLRVAAPAEPR